MKKSFIRTTIFCMALVASLISCGGGGGGDGLSTDACAVIGLPTRSLTVGGDRIVNGTACGDLAQSSVVRVVALGAGDQALGFCSGTVISSDEVLTAAHCFPRGTQSSAVIYGDPGNTTTIEGRSYRIHPGYIPVSQSNPLAAFNDVAIIHLSDTIPVPRAAVLVDSDVQIGEQIAIFGYGTDENGDFDFRELKSGEMEVADVTTTHISAYFDGEGSNTCTGDSGGPAFTESHGSSTVAGVTSTGTIENCSEGDNSLFIKLSGVDVRSFILTEVPEATRR